MLVDSVDYGVRLSDPILVTRHHVAIREQGADLLLGYTSLGVLPCDHGGLNKECARARPDGVFVCSN